MRLLPIALIFFAAAFQTRAADAVFERARAMYASLKSYQDTGTIVQQFASSEQRHSFTTRYKAPKHFYFEFNKDGGDRFVIWSEGEVFHTWWKSIGAQQDYARGQGVQAFLASDYVTSGSSMKIPGLLFAQAGLQGAFAHFADPVVKGMESIEGHECYRVEGIAKDVYGGTGREVNVRPMTVWIDASSLLIRKIFEDAAKGTAPVSAIRVTTTFEPQANPALEDARFQFAAPAK